MDVPVSALSLSNHAGSVSPFLHFSWTWYGQDNSWYIRQDCFRHVWFPLETVLGTSERLEQDLAALEYTDTLPSPFPAVQSLLSSIADSNFHTCIQSTDNAALLDRDDEGEHAPLLLTSLDLSH